MSYNFSEYYIPVFTGINDTPVAPIASKAGNGSHVVSQFNSFVEQLEGVTNSFDNSIDSLTQLEPRVQQLEITVSELSFNPSNGGSSSPKRWRVFTNEDDVTSCSTNPNDKIAVAVGYSTFTVYLPDSSELTDGDEISIVRLANSTKVQISNFSQFAGNSDVQEVYFNQSNKVITLIWDASSEDWFYIDNSGILNVIRTPS